MPKKMLVIGPSHVKRLEHALEYGILPGSRLTLEFLGRDGMPIWHPVFTKHLTSADYEHIFVIVGDFRFGNKIFAKTEAKQADGVAKELINFDNDQKLYEKSLATIDEWIALFGNKITFLFWDLLGREFTNRHENKYTIDGQYRHPVWNYDDVLERYQANIFNVGFINKVGMNRLAVDSANHFSMFAYLMIIDAIQHVENKKYLTKEELEFKFRVLDKKFNQLPLDHIYLVCDLPIFRRLKGALDSGALPNHSKLKLFTTQEFIELGESLSLAGGAKILYLNSFRRIDGEDNAAKYRRLVNTLNKISQNQPVFNLVFYDYLCDYIVELRKKQQEQPFKLPDPEDVCSLETLHKIHANAISYPIDDFMFLHSLFELSGRLPNFKGFFYLLMSAWLGQTSAEFVNFYYRNFISDVFEMANESFARTDVAVD